MEMKKENLNDLYYVHELEVSKDAKELKALLLENEVDHIKNNLNDFINGYMNLGSQCKTIEEIQDLDLERVIFELEKSWSYTITKIKYQDYRTKIIFKPTATLEEVQKVIDEIQKCYSREMIHIIQQFTRYFNDEINGHKKGVCISIAHRSSNIDIENIENFLNECDAILSWEY